MIRPVEGFILVACVILFTAATWINLPGLSGPITGATDGSNAAPGIVGEFISSQNLSGTPLTSGTTGNVASITLTPGDWDVWGIPAFVNSGVTLSNVSAAIGTTASALITAFDGSFLQLPFTLSGSVNNVISPVGPFRASLISSQTYYLNLQASFILGTVSGRGSIYARRMR